MHAFELKTLKQSDPTQPKTATEDIWWPFIKSCFMDMSMYGMCAYIKRKKGEVVYPEAVPIKDCHLVIIPFFVLCEDHASDPLHPYL